MKTIYRMILSMVCLSAAFSCNFLDVDIQNVTTKDNYYRNEQQLQEALDGVYAVLNDTDVYKQKWEYLSLCILSGELVARKLRQRTGFLCRFVI